MEGINSRISEAEERISELKDKMVEITSEEQNKVKRMKRTQDNLRYNLILWNAGTQNFMGQELSMNSEDIQIKFNISSSPMTLWFCDYSTWTQLSSMKER